MLHNEDAVKQFYFGTVFYFNLKPYHSNSSKGIVQYSLHIVPVLTKPRKVENANFSEKVKTVLFFPPKTRCQPNKDIIPCLNVRY